MNDFDYLNEEREKLWKKVVALEDLLKERTPEYEVKAKTSATKIEEVKKFVLQTQEKLNTAYQELKTKIDEISKSIPDLETKASTVETLIAKIEIADKSSTEISANLDILKTDAETKTTTINSVFDKNEELLKKFTELDHTLTQAKEASGKIEAINNSVAQRKEYIDTAYFEIYGQTVTDEETNEEKKVPGLKDELSDSFKELKTNLTALKETFDSEKDNNEKLYSKFYEKNNLDVTALKEKIKSLLPKALTAGLSHAFSAKKQEEIVESQQSARTFKWAILGMVIISLIPFIISFKFWLDSTPINDVILKLPRLVVSILPLYIPVLWIAYFNNKRLNLSKRLIEEYSHKEVLSKTYEGLAKQIDELGDSPSGEELKVKLLFNVLEVSSENPGKLISDYNKADHPLMDALDKSIKLSNSVERLSRIPGFTKIAEKLAKKSEKVLEKEKEKAEAGLEDEEG